MAAARAQMERDGETRCSPNCEPVADCLVAQSCIDNDVPLITYDRDFRHFTVAGLKLA